MKYSSSRWYPYLLAVASSATNITPATAHAHGVKGARTGSATI
jgi:hypothetical protein